MTDAWEERKKALENQYFYNLEKELIDKIKEDVCFCCLKLMKQ